MRREAILTAVAREVVMEQTRIHEGQLLEWYADDDECPDVLRLAALAEELGEVARCVHDEIGDIRGELIQLAGVAIAWASIFVPDSE